MIATDRKWTLGEDLLTSDNLLDGITFDELILTLHCNQRRDLITPEVVVRTLLETLECRREDMMFLLWNNMDKIIEYAKDYYRDE